MRACKAHSNCNFFLTRKYILNLYLNVWKCLKEYFSVLAPCVGSSFLIGHSSYIYDEV